MLLSRWLGRALFILTGQSLLLTPPLSASSSNNSADAVTAGMDVESIRCITVNIRFYTPMCAST